MTRLLRLALLLPLGCLGLAPATRGQQPPLPPARTGLLYISGYSTDNVGEYLPDGTLLRTFSHPSLRRPRGIGVDPSGDLAVVSQFEDRIIVFDLEGQVVQQVFHPDLTSGTGLARSASGDWYVGNFFPGRVLVFDPAWKHVETITHPGMNGVNCVSFDPGGSFAVTDASNHIVHRFAADHQYLGTADHPSLLSPMSIALDYGGQHYVSNGSSGVITKFDENWDFVMTFGAGVLDQPQGVLVDPDGLLTITNFGSDVVHRYDPNGNLLGSFPLNGVSIGRNASFQYSPYVLARQGRVAAAAGYPVPVLSLAGHAPDALGRVQVAAGTPLRLEISASPSGPDPAPVVLWARWGEPALGDEVDLGLGDSLLSFAPAMAGGVASTLVNSIGRESLFGSARFPAAMAPSTLFDLPAGLAFPRTITLQGLLRDGGSRGALPYSSTNALVITVQ